MRPMLDPARDLAGATPEKLARALLRDQLRPRSGILSSSMHKPLSKGTVTAPILRGLGGVSRSRTFFWAGRSAVLTYRAIRPILNWQCLGS